MRKVCGRKKEQWLQLILKIALIWSTLKLRFSVGAGSVCRSLLHLTGPSLLVLAVAASQHLIHRMPEIRRTSIQRTSRNGRVQLLLLHLLQLHATPERLEAASRRSRPASGRRRKYACTDVTSCVQLGELCVQFSSSD